MDANNKVIRRWDTKTFWGCEFSDGLITLRSVARRSRWAAATLDAEFHEGTGLDNYELSLYNPEGGDWVRRITGLTRDEVLALGKAWVSVK